MRSHRLDLYNVQLYLVTTRREWTTLRSRLTWLDSGPNVDSLGSCTFDVDFPKQGLPIPHVILWLDMKRLDVVSHEVLDAPLSE